MAYILNIETSTTNCSVSLAKNGETVVLKEDYNNGYSHAERLHVFIDEVLKSSGLQSSQLDAVAISKGPGSYTGLRIGVSAAKGLCFALNIPLISVLTLEALAHQAKVDKGVIVPMLDARRMEVYEAVFTTDYTMLQETKAKILDTSSYLEYLEQGNVTFIGNGVAKTQALITHPNANYIEDKLPSANEMSKLSYMKFKVKDLEDVAYFEPFYLKDFIGVKPKQK